MRAVLDTNILARVSYRAAGPAVDLFARLEQPQHLLVISPHILSELNRVLRYPRMQRQHQLSDEALTRFLLHLQSTALLVETADEATAVSGDPDDDPIVATAVVGQADVLCTLDRHFREPQVQRYCADHGIRILTDIELLGELRASDVDE